MKIEEVIDTITHPLAYTRLLTVLDYKTNYIKVADREAYTQGLRVASALCGWIPNGRLAKHILQWIKDDNNFDCVVSDICRTIESGDHWMYSAIRCTIKQPQRRHEWTPPINHIGIYNGIMNWFRRSPVWVRKVHPKRVMPLFRQAMGIDGWESQSLSRRLCDVFTQHEGYIDANKYILQRLFSMNHIGESIVSIRWNIGVAGEIMSANASGLAFGRRCVNYLHCKTLVKMLGLSAPEIKGLMKQAKRLDINYVNALQYGSYKRIAMYVYDGDLLALDQKEAASRAFSHIIGDPEAKRSAKRKIGGKVADIISKMKPMYKLSSKSLKEQLKRAEINHNLHRMCVHEAKSAEFEDGTPMPALLELPDCLESLRIKTAGAMRIAGRDCEHCLGSYVNRKEYMYFRQGNICAQVDSHGEVVQCYDVKDSITEESKSFKLWLTKRFRELMRKPRVEENVFDPNRVPTHQGYEYTRYR